MQLVVSITVGFFLLGLGGGFFLYFSIKAPETTSEQNFPQKGLSEHMFPPGPMPSDGQGTQKQQQFF